MEGADEGSDPFWTKLERQLTGADPEVVQLMGEMLYVDFLVVNKAAMRSATKRRRINQVLNWSSQPVDLPPVREKALDGFGGTIRTRYRFQEIRLLIRFTLDWKALTDEKRKNLICDPWEFKDMLWEVPVDSAYMLRNGLLHLVHPDTFEPLLWRRGKRRIAAAYRHLVSRPTEDIDRQLAQIRTTLTPKHGEGFYFGDVVERDPPTLRGLADALFRRCGPSGAYRSASGSSPPSHLLRSSGNREDVCGPETRRPSYG